MGTNRFCPSVHCRDWTRNRCKISSWLRGNDKCEYLWRSQSFRSKARRQIYGNNSLWSWVLIEHFWNTLNILGAVCWLRRVLLVGRGAREGQHHITSQHHTYRDNITTSQNNLQWQQQQHSAKYCDMEAVWDGTVLRHHARIEDWSEHWKTFNELKPFKAPLYCSHGLCHYGWISRSS